MSTAAARASREAAAQQRDSATAIVITIA